MTGTNRKETLHNRSWHWSGLALVIITLHLPLTHTIGIIQPFKGRILRCFFILFPCSQPASVVLLHYLCSEAGSQSCAATTFIANNALGTGQEKQSNYNLPLPLLPPLSQFLRSSGAFLVLSLHRVLCESSVSSPPPRGSLLVEKGRIIFIHSSIISPPFH